MRLPRFTVNPFTIGTVLYSIALGTVLGLLLIWLADVP